MAESCTCPHCGGDLICVGTIGPSAEDYADLAFARCVRLGCGEAMILGIGRPGVPAWKIPAWRGERARARAREALGIIVRAFTELWCVPLVNTCERAVLLVLGEGCVQLTLRVLREVWRRNASIHHRPAAPVIDRFFALQVGALLTPIVVCLLVGLLVAVTQSVCDTRRVLLLCRGELRRAELRVARSDYR